MPTTHVTTTNGSCDWSVKGGTSCGYNPLSDKDNGSEMAHLFFQSLGNKSYYVPGTTTVQAGWGLSNTGHFKNLQSFDYWSGTEYAPNSLSAWAFISSTASRTATSRTIVCTRWLCAPEM